jgi:hypothetical protein
VALALFRAPTSDQTNTRRDGGKEDIAGDPRRRLESQRRADKEMNKERPMTTKRDKSRLSDDEREREYVKGGKRPEPDDPRDAEFGGESDFVDHRGKRRFPNDELDFDTDQSWGSE